MKNPSCIQPNSWIQIILVFNTFCGVSSTHLAIFCADRDSLVSRRLEQIRLKRLIRSAGTPWPCIVVRPLYTNTYADYPRSPCEFHWDDTRLGDCPYGSPTMSTMSAETTTQTRLFLDTVSISTSGTALSATVPTQNIQNTDLND